MLRAAVVEDPIHQRRAGVMCVESHPVGGTGVERCIPEPVRIAEQRFHSERVLPLPAVFDSFAVIRLSASWTSSTDTARKPRAGSSARKATGLKQNAASGLARRFREGA
jgi:hypothetical protein